MTLKVVVSTIAIAALGLVACGGEDAPSEADVAAIEQYNCGLIFDESAAEVTDVFRKLKDGGGYNYDDYEDVVSDLFDNQPDPLPSEVSEKCAQDVQKPLEKAINAYGEASSIWNDCLYDADEPACDGKYPGGAITPDDLIQSSWSTAEDAVEDMNAGRDQMIRAAAGGELPEGTEARASPVEPEPEDPGLIPVPGDQS